MSLREMTARIHRQLTDLDRALDGIEAIIAERHREWESRREGAANPRERAGRASSNEPARNSVLARL